MTDMTRRSMLQAVGGLFALATMTPSQIMAARAKAQPMDMGKAQPERVAKPGNPFPYLKPGLQRQLHLHIKPNVLASEVKDDLGNKLGLVQSVTLLPQVLVVGGNRPPVSQHDEDVVSRRQLVQLELCCPSPKPKFFTGGKEDKYRLLAPEILPSPEPDDTDILAVTHGRGGFPDLAFIDGAFDPFVCISWATVKGWAIVHFHPGIVPGMYFASSEHVTWQPAPSGGQTLSPEDVFKPYLAQESPHLQSKLIPDNA